MIDIEKLDDELYKSIYGKPKTGDYNEIWTRIKSNPEVLREAVQIQRDKFDESYIVKGLTICNALLIDYKSVDEVAYNNLINSIYTNTDIARMVVNGASNGGYSFLLMSLWNHTLKLTEEQKAFAVDEAMNKVGTVRWDMVQERFSRKLDDKGISDKNTIYMEFAGSINPIGEKTGAIYMDYMLSSLGRKQARGTGEFDIRYHILRNPNWTIEEKQKLIMDFWTSDKAYDNCLEQWEWGIVNDEANFEKNFISPMEPFMLYKYTYNGLLRFYGDKETTDRIWDEINFCRTMRELRTPSYLKNEDTPVLKRTINN